MALDKNPVCSGDFAGGSDVFFNRGHGSIQLGFIRFQWLGSNMPGCGAKMKRVLLALSFTCLAVSSSYAERVVLTFLEKSSRDPLIQLDYRDITLTEGQMIGLATLAGPTAKMKVLLGDFSSGSFPALDSAEKAYIYKESTGGSKGFFVSGAKGPCKVRITPAYNIGTGLWPNGMWGAVAVDQFETICEYEITSTTTTSSSSIQSISNTAVVVPSNAVGDVDVLLEQSNDMITWTQCLPGTYNASTQKRFFRVRAVEK
jgi:hypothetical protein